MNNYDDLPSKTKPKSSEKNKDNYNKKCVMMYEKGIEFIKDKQNNEKQKRLINTEKYQTYTESERQTYWTSNLRGEIESTTTPLSKQSKNLKSNDLVFHKL